MGSTGRYSVPGVVIGVSPTKGQVLVRNPAGETYWKPGTRAQIEDVSKRLKTAGDYGEIEYPEYRPPSGVSSSKPATGSLARQVGKDFEVYTYTGKTVKLSPSKAEKLVQLTGKSQFNEMSKLGIIPKGSKFVEGDKGSSWQYIPPWEVKAEKQFRESHTQLPGGQWMSNSELQKVQQKSPQAFKILTARGFDALQQTIEQNTKKLEPFISEEGKLNLGKSVKAGHTDVSEYLGWGVTQQDIDEAKVADKPWYVSVKEAVTPWDESKGETIKDFSVKGATLSQAELKQVYQAEQDALWWEKFIFGPSVVKRNDGSYAMLVKGDAPQISAGPVKPPTRIPKITLSTKDIGRLMTKEKFERFVAERARMLQSRLAEGERRAGEAMGFLKQPVDQFGISIPKVASKVAPKTAPEQYWSSKQKLPSALIRFAEPSTKTRQINELLIRSLVKQPPVQSTESPCFLSAVAAANRRSKELLQLSRQASSGKKPTVVVTPQIQPPTPQEIEAIKTKLNLPDVDVAKLTGAATQVDQALATALNQAIETAAQTQSKVATQQALQTAVNNITQPQVRTAVKEALQTETLTKTETLTQPATKTKVQVKTTTPTKLKTKLKTKPTSLRLPDDDLRLPDDDGFEIEHAEGIPERNPGIVTWKQGLYWISAVPPYRKGQKDLVYSRIRPASATRTGGPQETLHVSRGKPPDRLVVDVGAFDAHIQHGKIIDFKKEKQIMKRSKRR